jgi:meso-butanediol dehydrogenase / (S,S)-butanediol dehydrogenase / diacetyl reductase
MSSRFEGRHVVVVGAHGIGRACVERFGAEGASVTVLDRDVAEAAAVATDTGQRSGEIDVLDRASVDAAFAALERVDVLVHVAGGALPQEDFLDSTDAEWLANLDLNLLGVARTCRAAFPLLRRSGAGAVVLVSSINGLAAIGDEAYSAAKAGLSSLARNLARTGGPDGVRVNVVAPGTVRTRAWADAPGGADSRAGWYPLGRVGEPADIAAAAAFLGSSDAAWITGHTLPVDGGYLINAGPS